MKKVYEKHLVVFFVAITLVFPFVNLFHVFYSVSILGKSAWITVPVIALGIAYLYLTATNRSKMTNSDLKFFIIMTIGLFIYAIRELIYSEGRNLLNYRYIATSLMFILLYIHIKNNDILVKSMMYAISLQGAFVALARSINYYFFPNLMISYDGENGFGGEAFINSSGELTRDLLMGASISANHIVCGMFMLITLKRHFMKRLPFSIFMACQFFMMLSTFNTGSRYPMTVAVGLFTLSMFQIRIFSGKEFKFVFIGLMMVTFAVILVSEYSNFFERFGEDSGGRYEKLQLTFLFISTSATDFLIGSSSSFINSTTLNNIVLSDNSYGLIATSLGVPFSIIFFWFLFSTLWKIKADWLSLIFLLYILIGLGITNCISWEPWVFTALFAYGITSYYGRMESIDRQTSGIGRTPQRVGRARDFLHQLHCCPVINN